MIQAISGGLPHHWLKLIDSACSRAFDANLVHTSACSDQRSVVFEQVSNTSN